MTETPGSNASLDYAIEVLYEIVHKADDGEANERLEKLDRISTIISLLSKKIGWPEAIEHFLQLFAA